MIKYIKVKIKRNSVAYQSIGKFESDWLDWNSYFTTSLTLVKVPQFPHL